MTWYKCDTTSSSDWTNSNDPYNFKREYMGSFDLSEDIKKEAKPPPNVIYFDPEELVL
jgi:hypothetical protein